MQRLLRPRRHDRHERYLHSAEARGTSRRYVGTADIESTDAAIEAPTYWVPDVVRGNDDLWHEFLTVVPGVFNDWGHPRQIAHNMSDDLRT